MKALILTILTLSCTTFLIAQDELKWKEEVKNLQDIPVESVKGGEGLLLLTGSSSARMWKDVKKVFPKHTVVNNGFGGSQMHELLFFLDELVIDYKPDIIMIYEGDNDVNAGKTEEDIMKHTRAVVAKIKKNLPAALIYFISPKPSLARWNLEQRYIDLNKKMKAYCETEDNVAYIDVWYPMLGSDGKVRDDIFIQDGLHMNEKGYKIWAEVISAAVLLP